MYKIYLYPCVETHLTEAVSAGSEDGLLQDRTADTAQQVLIHRPREATHRVTHSTPP